MGAGPVGLIIAAVLQVRKHWETIWGGIKKATARMLYVLPCGTVELDDLSSSLSKGRYVSLLGSRVAAHSRDSPVLHRFLTRSVQGHKRPPVKSEISPLAAYHNTLKPPACARRINLKVKPLAAVISAKPFLGSHPCRSQGTSLATLGHLTPRFTPHYR